MANDQDAAACVKFLNQQARYAPNGSIKELVDHKDADATYTLGTTKYQYQRSQFLKQVVTVGFESLSQTTKPDESLKWSYSTTIPDPDGGNDMADFTLALNQSEILQSFTFTKCNSDQEKQQFSEEHDINPGDTTIVIDGEEYFVNLNIPLHFLYMDEPDVIINFVVFVIANTALSAAVASVIAGFGLGAFAEAFAGIEGSVFGPVWDITSAVMRSGYRFTTGLIEALLEGESAVDAVVAAGELAGEVWAVAMEELTASLLAYSVIGIIVMAAVFAFFHFIFQESYQKVFVYNLTEYDVEISFPYIDNGNIYNLSTNLVAAPSDVTSGGFDLGTYYNAVSFTVQSDSETTGIGYTMRLDLKKPGTSEIVKTFSALFDIPMTVMGNSLLCKDFNPIDIDIYGSYKTWYEKAGHEYNTYYYTWDHQNENEMSVSYDYQSGNHKDPETGKSLHLFNSIVYIGNK